MCPTSRPRVHRETRYCGRTTAYPGVHSAMGEERMRSMLWKIKQSSVEAALCGPDARIHPALTHGAARCAVHKRTARTEFSSFCTCVKNRLICQGLCQMGSKRAEKLEYFPAVQTDSFSARCNRTSVPMERTLVRSQSFCTKFCSRNLLPAISRQGEKPSLRGQMKMCTVAVMVSYK